MNNAAIDKGVESVVKINVPESWKHAKDENETQMKLDQISLKI